MTVVVYVQHTRSQALCLWEALARKETALFDQYLHSVALLAFE